MVIATSSTELDEAEPPVQTNLDEAACLAPTLKDDSMNTTEIQLRGARRMGVLAGVSFALLVVLGGCNNCEELTEKVCSELGDECALWKEIGGPEDITPQGRKVNKACGTIMDNELALEGTLISARGKVLGERLQRAVKKDDKKEIEKVKAELEQNRKRVEESIKKVKQRNAG